MERACGRDGAAPRYGQRALPSRGGHADPRDRFRAALAVDDGTWARGRGWALSQAVGALAYYTMDTNPTLVVEARSWLAEVLADGTLEP